MCFQVSAFTPDFIHEVFCQRDKRVKRCLRKWAYKKLLILLLRGCSCLPSPLVWESHSSLLFYRPLHRFCSFPTLFCQRPGIDGSRTPPARRGVTAPAGTRPCPHPLSCGAQAMAGPWQMMHSMKIPQDLRAHHPPWRGHPARAIPKFPARQIISGQSPPCHWWEMLCQREGAGSPSALAPHAGMGMHPHGRAARGAARLGG